MKKIDDFVEAGNIKFRTNYRDSIYNILKEGDESGLFKSSSEVFYIAFSIGYHFNQQASLTKGSINHVNLVSFDRDIKELMVKLVLNRNPNIDDPKELWSNVETYAEYGVQVLYNSWKKNNKMIELDSIVETI
jgi:hypothetical protein